MEYLAQTLGIQAPTSAPVKPLRKPRGPRREIIYKVTDPQTGAVIAEHIRTEYPEDLDPESGKPRKELFWRRNGNNDLGGLPVTDLPLYYPPSLAPPPPGSLVFLVEGEPDAEALAARGLCAFATVTGAGCNPCEQSLRVLVGLEVVVWADADPPGGEHMEKNAATLTRLENRPRVFLWPDAPFKGAGAADFTGGNEEILALTQTA